MSQFAFLQREWAAVFEAAAKAEAAVPGLSTPCSSMFMLPMRSMVLSKSKPWNMR